MTSIGSESDVALTWLSRTRFIIRKTKRVRPGTEIQQPPSDPTVNNVLAAESAEIVREWRVPVGLFAEVASMPYVTKNKAVITDTRNLDLYIYFICFSGLEVFWVNI